MVNEYTYPYTNLFFLFRFGVLILMSILSSIAINPILDCYFDSIDQDVLSNLEMTKDDFCTQMQFGWLPIAVMLIYLYLVQRTYDNLRKEYRKTRGYDV